MRRGGMTAFCASPTLLARKDKLIEKPDTKSNFLEAIGDCIVRVDDPPDHLSLAQEVRAQSLQLLSTDSFVDTCLVWFQHVLVAEELLLFTNFHGLHDLEWHLGPLLETELMLKDSRINVLYWLFGAATLSGLQFLVTAAVFASSSYKFGCEASFYIFSHRSGLFCVALISNPGVVLSANLLILFHLPGYSQYQRSDIRALLVITPITFVIGCYFAWSVFEWCRAKKAGPDITILRYKKFPADTMVLLCVKAGLFILTELLIICKMEGAYDTSWIRVISPLLALFGIVMLESMVRISRPLFGRWKYCKCCEMKMPHQLDVIASIDTVCFATVAVLVACMLDNPTWRPWSKSVAVPIIALFSLHSLWFIFEIFLRISCTLKPTNESITFFEPVLIGLNMDEEMKSFEVCNAIF